MKSYKPSGKAPIPGLIRLGLATTFGNALVGGLLHLLSKVIYVVLVFPLLMGATAGGLAFAATYGGKIRNPLLTILSGLLGGLCIYGTTHGLDYWQFRQEAIAELSSPSPNDADVPRSDSTAIVDQFLQEQTGDAGFVGYLKFTAQRGVTIGRFSGTGINLGETGTWIYWLVELGLIEVVAGVLAYGAASQVFCEKCDRWYANGTAIGGV